MRGGGVSKRVVLVVANGLNYILVCVCVCVCVGGGAIYSLSLPLMLLPSMTSTSTIPALSMTPGAARNAPEL